MQVDGISVQFSIITPKYMFVKKVELHLLVEQYK
jgi:hypothetical protein